MAKPPHFGLWRNMDFMKLWAGETISLLGSQVTLLALPLVATVTLDATPVQMGVLGTLQYIPWLIVGLPAGAWIDRMRRRPVMVAADLLRAALLATIPLAALSGILMVGHLYLVAFLVGVMNVFFDIAYMAFLPSLLPENLIVEGNAKLQVSASIAEIAGPGLAGVLVQWLSAPVAIVTDVFSFVVSAAALARIGAWETIPVPIRGTVPMVVEIREGLRFVFSNPILRAFAAASMTTNFFIDMHLAVFVMYAIRELHFSPVLIGGMYAVGSLGGLLGSLLADRLPKRLGLGPVIVGTQIFVTLAVFSIPLAGGLPAIAVPVIVLAQAVWAFAVVVYVVNAASLRQMITPANLQGRAAASLRFVSWGIAPFGFLLGGFLGEWIGLRGTLYAAALGPALSVVWILLSPVSRLRKPPGSGRVNGQPSPAEEFASDLV
ncbi:MAG: MFS transporter [Anaerolineales bacterium]